MEGVFTKKNVGGNFVTVVMRPGARAWDLAAVVSTGRSDGRAERERRKDELD
jgi:hypothetical protein